MCSLSRLIRVSWPGWVEKLLRLLASGLLHPLPDSNGFLGIIAGVCRKQEPDIIGLRFVGPAERQEYAHLRTDSQSGHRSLTGGRTEPLGLHGDGGPYQTDLREDTLAHAFGSVACERMDDFVPNDGRKTRLIVCHREDAGIDGDLPARQGKGVLGTVVFDHGDFPLKVLRRLGVFRPFGCLDDARRDSLDRRNFCWVPDTLTFGSFRTS